MRPFSGVAQPCVCALCHGKSKPGGIVEQSCGAAAPHRFTDEVSPLSAIPASLRGGNHRLKSLSAALPLSYSNFCRWQGSNLRPSDPAVTQAFTTPQTLQSFSFPSYIVTSLLLPPRTPVAFPHCDVSFRQRNPPNIFSGGIGAHGISGFEPEPCGLAVEVPVNFTIPGSCCLKKSLR
jgi:hypothetical protein